MNHCLTILRFLLLLGDGLAPAELAFSLDMGMVLPRLALEP
jgi:hypothetical protein